MIRHSMYAICLQDGLGVQYWYRLALRFCHLSIPTYDRIYQAFQHSPIWICKKKGPFFSTYFPPDLHGVEADLAPGVPHFFR